MQVLLIEVNTVPGMTPSTVLIHQVGKLLLLLQGLHLILLLLLLDNTNVWYGGNESQALAEEPPVYPHRFFRTLLDLVFARAK
jgi:hypothetical protein